MRYDSTAFEIDRKPVSFGAVVALGIVSGEVAAALEELRDALAADAFLDREGRGVGSEEIAPALNAWRSERGLTSAELTRHWLEVHGLELSDLVAHVSRTLAVARIGEELERAREACPAPIDRTIQLLLDHLLYTGRLADLLQDAMLRASIEPPEDHAAYLAERRALEAMLAPGGGIAPLAGLFGLPAEEADEVLAIQARFLAADRRVCAPDALVAEMQRSRRNLTKVEYAEAIFAEEGVAREVIATLRDDRQMWLEQLAHHLEIEPTRHHRYVDELGSSALGTRLANGAVGEVAGPERQATGFHVYEVLGRHEPRIEDPEVRSLLERRLRKKAFAAAVERRARAHYV